jgi:hypothetical protein
MRLAIKMLAKNSDLDSEPSGIRTLDTPSSRTCRFVPPNSIEYRPVQAIRPISYLSMPSYGEEY